DLRETLALSRRCAGVKLLALVDVEEKARGRGERKLLSKIVIGCLDDVREPRIPLAKPLSPFAATVNARWVCRVLAPQCGAHGHELVDRVVAGLHGQIGERAAVLQRLRPGTPSPRPALSLERPNRAGLHKA